VEAYRALLLRYDVLKLPPEAQQRIPALLRVQEEFRRWAAEWAKNGGKVPLPERSPLKYLAREFVHAWNALKQLRGQAIKRGMRPPMILDAQLRLNGERDLGRGALVDVAKREVRVRRLGTGTIALPLSEGAARWILERVNEGARLVMAAVWVDGTRLCIALIFRRDVTPIEARRILAIDLNALHNGISYAIVGRDRVLRRGILRPDASRLERLQRETGRLDAMCARRGDPYCEMARTTRGRYWRLLREWAKEAARFVVRLALQYKAAIVIDVPESESIRELKQSESYPAGRKALLDFGKLRRWIRGLAEWHGVPYIEARLYSTICPRCQTRMLELQNRRVKCQKCGLEAGRDEVPAMWAARRFDELLKAAKSQLPSFSAPCRMLIYPTAMPLSWRAPPAGRGASPAPLPCCPSRLSNCAVAFMQAEGGGTARTAAAPPRDPRAGTPAPGARRGVEGGRTPCSASLPVVLSRREEARPHLLDVLRDRALYR
jgi:putative transposase